MLTGIVNQESLAQLLQSIAQRRKQGDLEITLAELAVKISFIQGKIVEFSEGALVPAHEVFALMKRSGVFKNEVPEFSGISYQELLKFSEEHWAGQGTPAETLKSAVKKRLLDKLHPFEIEGTVPWGFRVGGVGVDRGIAAGTSVGQLLLDWAEVDAVWDRWERELQPGIIVSRAKEFSGTPGPDESALIAHLEHPRTLEDLEARSFLDTLAFRQAVLSLLDSGGVLREAPAIPVVAAPVVPSENATPSAPAELAVATPEPAPKPKRQRKARAPKPRRETASESVPHLVALVMLIGAVVRPFFFWQEAFTQF